MAAQFSSIDDADEKGNRLYKARILAERYSAVFGLEAEYIPTYIEDEEQLKKLVTPCVWEMGRYYSERKWHTKTLTELVILIGAVDNNKSRSLCHRVFYQVENLVCIDSGNGEYTGQVVCGVRSGGRTCQKPVGVLYPEILDGSDKIPTELSCAEASVSAPQAITANITAACAVVDLVYNILVRGETSVPPFPPAEAGVPLWPAYGAAGAKLPDGRGGGRTADAGYPHVPLSHALPHPARGHLPHLQAAAPQRRGSPGPG